MYMLNSFHKDWAFLVSHFRLNNTQKPNKFYKKCYKQTITSIYIKHPTRDFSSYKKVINLLKMK